MAMTEIAIQPLTAANQAGLNCCDNSFTVEAELRLTAEDGRIGYSVEPVTPYVKRYGPEIFDAQAYHREARSRGVAGLRGRPDRRADPRA